MSDFLVNKCVRSTNNVLFSACPGYQLAITNLFLIIAPVLSAFNILPTRNSHGEDELPPITYDDGHVR